jgi:hypothetical protein
VPDGWFQNGFRDSFVCNGGSFKFNSSNFSFVQASGIEFSDINLTKRLGPFVPCNSQSLLLADFKQTMLYGSLKNLQKNPQNKKN